jgi:hypothetical protein
MCHQFILIFIGSGSRIFIFAKRVTLYRVTQQHYETKIQDSLSLTSEELLKRDEVAAVCTNILLHL